MERIYSQETLKDLTHLLKQLNLCESSTKIGNWTIPNSAFSIFNACSLLLYITMANWLCFEYSYNLAIVSGALMVSIGDVQVLLIFICLTIRRSLIVDSLLVIQEIVDERECEL